MKASDLDEVVILASIKNAPKFTLGQQELVRSMTHWQGFDNSICDQGAPQKVLLAKLRAMEKKGLIEGCACGCRGDWGLKEK